MSVIMPTHDLDRLSRSGLTAADLENLDEDLAGRPVFDRAGETIGNVEDELIDARQLRAPFLLLTWGGVFGIGRQHRLVPIEIVDRVEEEGVHISKVREVVESAPVYSEPIPPDEAEPQYVAIYEHYGLMPITPEDKAEPR